MSSPKGGKIPDHIQKKVKAFRLLTTSVPLLLISSYMLYKRVYLGEEKRVQTGELLPDGSNIQFEPEEIARREKENIFTKVFGDEEKVKKILKKD